MVDVANLSYLPEVNEWDEQIPRLENGWLPTGGAVDPGANGGLMNWQAQLLARRTRWLKTYVDDLQSYWDEQPFTFTGRFIMPNGLILAWGRVLNVDDGDTIVFPLAFPSVCLNIMVQDGQASDPTNSHMVITSNVTRTGAQVAVFKNDDGQVSGNSTTVSYQAIGY